MTVVVGFSLPGAGKVRSDGYCDGFEDRTEPSLSQPAFIEHDVPAPLDSMPPVIADFDNDGRPDLPYLQNLGGFKFTARSEVVDLIRSVLTDTAPQNYHGIAVADFDGDGLPDLIVAPYNSPFENLTAPIVMLHNLGNWQFELINRNFLENLLGYNPYAQWHSETIVVGDLTGNGTSDFFIPFYPYDPPHQSVLLHQTANGLAEEALARGLGLQDLTDHAAEGAQAVDINNDGYLDLYAGHHLFINDGTGHFTDHAADYGLPDVWDEGVAFVDINNDGLLDLFIRTPELDKQLWQNTGHGFINVSVTSGLACLTQNYDYFWGDAWADFNRDGNIDLLYMVSTPDGYKNLLLLNQGNGQFTLGSVQDWLIQLAATTDLDGNGALDVAGLDTISENVLTPPGDVFNLTVTPEDAKGVRNQQGTTVRVKDLCPGDPLAIQTRIAGSTGVYLAQSDYATHFALKRQCHYEVDVAFPSLAGQPPDIETIDFTPTGGTATELVVRRDTDVQAIDHTPAWLYLPIVAR